MTPTVFTVRLSDGRSIQAVVKIADLIAFERQFDKPVSEMTSRIEHSTFIAYAALKRQGDVTCDFEEFLPLVEEIDTVAEAESDDPKD